MKSLRRTSPLVAIAALATIVGFGSCTPSSRLPVAPSPTIDSSPRDLGELVNLTQPAEIVYRTSERDPGKGPGTVVLRVSGSLNRWDTLPSSKDALTTRYFTVYKPAEDSIEAFGCEWHPSPGERTRVRAACSEGSAGPGSHMELSLGSGGYVFTDPAVRRIADRMVLDRQVPCYRGHSIEAICIDEQGRVLYFELPFPRGGSEVLEAVSVSDDVEPFGWPADSSLSTPTSAPVEVPVNTLDLPRQFQLGQ